MTIGQGKTIVDGVAVYDFSTVQWFWLGAAILSVVCALTVWNAKAEED
jgi:OPA family sugar phosphate sensor protein UhpC-like MFS transporter